MKFTLLRCDLRQRLAAMNGSRVQEKKKKNKQHMELSHCPRCVLTVSGAPLVLRECAGRQIELAPSFTWRAHATTKGTVSSAGGRNASGALEMPAILSRCPSQETGNVFTTHQPHDAVIIHFARVADHGLFFGCRLFRFRELAIFRARDLALGRLGSFTFFPFRRLARRLGRHRFVLILGIGRVGRLCCCTTNAACARAQNTCGQSTSAATPAASGGAERDAECERDRDRERDILTARNTLEHELCSSVVSPKPLAPALAAVKDVNVVDSSIGLGLDYSGNVNMAMSAPKIPNFRPFFKCLFNMGFPCLWTRRSATHTH